MKKQKDAYNDAAMIVPTASIKPATKQPRRDFDKKKLAELALSVEADGILQPILVRPTADPADPDISFEIVMGERRWRAAEAAGLPTVPIIIKEASDADRWRLALVENIQREDLTPIEEAEAFAVLISETGISQRELARSMGLSSGYVSNRMALRKTREDVKRMVSSNPLTMSHALRIDTVTSPNVRQRLIDATVAGAPFPEIDMQVRQWQARQRPEPNSKNGRPLVASVNYIEHLQAVERQLLHLISAATDVPPKRSQLRQGLKSVRERLDELEELAR